MKIDRRRQAILAVSLLSLFTAAHAVLIEDAIPASDLSDERSAAVDLNEANNVAEVRAVKEEADYKPYDGKDGLPHDGPWVETTAQRERKKQSKSLDEDEDEEVIPSKKEKSYESSLRTQDMPQSNDGVMDDPDRESPVEGKRGTEGGISEKSRSVTTSDEKSGSKKPDPPKEQPPLPHSENLKIHEADADEEDAGGSDYLDAKPLLAKPTDLPSKPHSIPLPENPSSPKDPLMDPHSQSSTQYTKLDNEPEPGDIIQPMHSLFLSFTMIMFSEIGDKTFLVACLMAMRHDRLLVFTAAFSALITMTILSAVLGHAVPTLIPKSITNFLASGLFLVFGVKMLLEARHISPDEGVSEEMKEVEMELEEKEHAAQRRFTRHHRTSSNLVTPYMLEAGRKLPSPPSSPSSTSSSRAASPTRGGAGASLKSALSGLNNLFSLLLSPAWVQTFVMTFLGEWGDRSQIATIAMAAGQDYWWVTAGALGGHAICTGMAVIGGKAIAGKVSLRTVTMGGAIAFLIFGFIYLAEAI